MIWLLDTMNIVHDIEFDVAKVIYKSILETCHVISKFSTSWSKAGCKCL